MKQSICALIVGALLLIGAGTIETLPIVTVMCLAGMAVAVKAGELWQIK